MSARPFVKAATAAGYNVIALDAFADVDTCAMASHTYRVGYTDGCLSKQDIVQVLESMDLQDVAGLVYGSGFEASPELLDVIQGYVPVLGNTSQILRNLKRPRQFFMLLDVLRIPHPEVSFKPLGDASGWLYKQGGGSGGAHIRKALPIPSIAPARGYYFQREIRGTAVSLLFAANGSQSKVIGFNELWMSSTGSMPYRYGGAVSHAVLSHTVEQQLIQIAQQITNAVGLRGINSLDAVIEDDKVHVLEINPRLSATFDLYQGQSLHNADLFNLHLQSCAGALEGRTQVAKVSRAHHVAYARCPTHLALNMPWPEWVADIPHGGSYIAAHQPLCTILAEADTPEGARALALTREETLQDIIQPYQKTG
ncbi:MAG TPA: ATP-grasp domain-containing protein [Methylophilaceae bacterium]|nr:ATP-grasp domain-containing protein [Methylophilaceae bacterium]